MALSLMPKPPSRPSPKGSAPPPEVIADPHLDRGVGFGRRLDGDPVIAEGVAEVLLALLLLMLACCVVFLFPGLVGY